MTAPGPGGPKENGRRPHVPLADCPTCASLGTHNYEDLMDGGEPPAAITALIGFPPLGGDGIVRCPTCDTWYEYVYSVGFQEHDIALRRISPAAAGAATDVAGFTRDLDHPHEDTRDYAALALADYHLRRDDRAAVTALLTHRDAKVRVRAVVSVLYSKDIEAYLATMVDLLFDPDANVRGNAGRMRSYHPELLRRHREEILVRLAASPSRRDRST